MASATLAYSRTLSQNLHSDSQSHPLEKKRAGSQHVRPTGVGSNADRENTEHFQKEPRAHYIPQAQRHHDCSGGTREPAQEENDTSNATASTLRLPVALSEVHTNMEW